MHAGCRQVGVRYAMPAALFLTDFRVSLHAPFGDAGGNGIDVLWMVQ
jgi:hypothetical protein